MSGKRVAVADAVRVLGKNPNGYGSVYQRADGRWVATWRVPGDLRLRRATGKTRDVAIERRTQRLAEVASPIISCDPRVQWGRACVAGTRIPAETLAEMHWAGDSVAFLVEFWGEIGRLDVLWSCVWWVNCGDRWRTVPYTERRTRWTMWSDHAQAVLASEHTSGLCDPDEFGDA